MRTLLLYEYQCKECDEIILLEYDKEPGLCPYCGGCTIDYAPGKIVPVLSYIPRKYKKDK